MTARTHLRSQTSWIAFIDLVCLVIAGVVAILMRFSAQEIIEEAYVYKNINGWLVLFGAVMLGNYLAGAYRMQYTFSRFNILVTWLFALGFGLLVVTITSYAWVELLVGRGVLALIVLWYSGLSLFLKLVAYRILFRSDAFTCRVVVVGNLGEMASIRNLLENKWVLPIHKVVTFVEVTPEDEATSHGTMVDGVAVIQVAAGDFGVLIDSLGASLVVVTQDNGNLGGVLCQQLRRLRFSGTEVLTSVAAAEVYSGRSPLELINEDTLMDISMESGLPVVHRTKRLLDILCAIIGLVLVSPFLLLIALLIKVCSPGSPVVYSQSRVGQFGKLFWIHKFRTMREGAEDASGPVWSDKDDPRITGIGRVLRRFRLDELLQLLNILKGEMSVVGPRPERPELVAGLESEILYYHERTNVPPGLTGWAQIRYPYGSSVEDAKRKLEYDFYYIKHLSFSLDLQIVLRTIRIVLFGKERAG